MTIRILPPATVLLITGPNTGGKTVALKTAGLLTLMTQSGLWIPAADGSRLPVFRSVFADIGDEQSIDASLSTFSGHVANLVATDRRLTTPALVLVDEIGSGTDPIEGGALGVAVVDHFKARGATVIATSHYDALKTYASTTEGVASAAFGFNPDTFAPTYELIYGSPGRSLALEIAGRLGLDPSIIASARRNLTAREAQLAEHLAKMDHDLRALEHEQRLTARERQTLGEAEARMRQREDALRQREETFRRRLNDEVDAQVRDARREIDRVIAELKAKSESLAKAPRLVTTGEIGAARAAARGAVDDAAARAVSGRSDVGRDAPSHDSTARDSSPSDLQSAISNQQSAISTGARVIVGAFGLQGTVTAVHGDSADVEVNGKRMRSSLRDLRVIESAPAARTSVKVNIDLHPRDQMTADLNVVGCTVDEAIARAERFLDESLLTDQHTIRLIHGYGTGQLKRALAGFLQQHPLVASFGTAPPDQGGGGVTVVELKD
ncbi:MAG TPA: Smr/MutS family protein [Candidatus Bathyarchaeia archaeon]|nr:Smr/MutS family protein [Candidatus Bathyarchaeia archaeon]